MQHSQSSPPSTCPRQAIIEIQEGNQQQAGPGAARLARHQISTATAVNPRLPCWLQLIFQASQQHAGAWSLTVKISKGNKLWLWRRRCCLLLL